MQQTRVVEIDAAAFADAFAHRSVAIRHHLVEHPLFTIDAIADLADRLPPESVRRERGDLPLANYGSYVDVGDGPPSQTIKDVRTNGVRISLRDIHQAPEYAELINECLDQVDELVADRERRDDAAGRVSVHHRPGLDDAHALRRRAQLLAPDQGCKARPRRRLRGRTGRASTRVRSICRRSRVRLRRDAGRRRRVRHRAGGRRLPAVLRAALGGDGGGDLDLVLDPLPYGVRGAGGGCVADQQAAAADPSSHRGPPARRSPSTRRSRRSSGRGSSCRRRATSCRRNARFAARPRCAARRRTWR